jgi:phenylalanyl-tRNA synthetase beta chain
VPRFPAVERDIALVVDEAVTHNCVKEIIKGFPLVARVNLFDVYSGKQVPPGRKSLAYRIIFQSPAHTLTDDEVDGVQEQILNRLSRELGATLRG